jgi:hypothetical protein
MVAVSGDTLTLDTLRKAMAFLEAAPKPRLPTYVLVSRHAGTVDDQCLIINWTILGAGSAWVGRPTWEALATPRVMIRLARELRRAGMPNPRRVWKRPGTALYLLRNARSIPVLG